MMYLPSSAVQPTRLFGYFRVFRKPHSMVLPGILRFQTGEGLSTDWCSTVYGSIDHFEEEGNGRAPCASMSQRLGILFLQFGINRSIQCSERCAMAAQKAHCCDSDVDSGSAGKRAPPALMRCTKPSNNARIEGSGAPEGPGRELVWITWVSPADSFVDPQSLVSCDP